MLENGACVWTKVTFDKNRIFWRNPSNGFAIAVLRESHAEIPLPDVMPNFKENFENFKTLWEKLYDLDLLYSNIQDHQDNQENCCLNWEFPFIQVCSMMYSKFDPGGDS